MLIYSSYSNLNLENLIILIVIIMIKYNLELKI